MLEQQKIIFTGPVGAGKTTAISAICDGENMQTEALATDETADIKENTTVAMDYGTLKLDDGNTVHLYGTPGQDRFDFMWDILTKSGIGLVLLIDNTRDDPLEDMANYINSFKDFISEHEIVIGVNRYAEVNRPGLYSYHTKLEELGMRPPIFEVDSRDRNDIKILLMALLAMLDPALKR
ncbi:putative ATP/GTP-binding protein [hydrothermal vent metagenome]|uniref:Putative ATP/GTP-binding protein n=1 Tax=hydrothermal vent metagenome TaxID=652676 RepID=A0A3B0X721_9ZZZZ